MEGILNGYTALDIDELIEQTSSPQVESQCQGCCFRLIEAGLGDDFYRTLPNALREIKNFMDCEENCTLMAGSGVNPDTGKEEAYLKWIPFLDHFDNGEGRVYLKVLHANGDITDYVIEVVRFNDC